MKIIKITQLSLVMLLMVSLNVHAVLPRAFSSENKSFFNGGKYEGVMLTEKNELTLAPKITKIATLDMKHIWKIYPAGGDMVYAAVSGDNAQIYKVNTKDGSSTLFTQASNDTAFTSITTDTEGNVYAAVGPNARIYKYDVNGTLIWESILEDIYVWDMEFDSNNNLYASTGGNNARVLNISTTDGTSTEIIKNNETHAVTLHYDSMTDTFYVGTSGRGLLLELDIPNKSYTVVYDTGEKEVHTITTDKIGNVYFGTSAREKSSAILPSIIDSQSASKDITQKMFRNSLYKVNDRKVVQRLFYLTQTLLFALNSDNDNNIYFITGDQADIYKITAKDGLLNYIGSLKGKSITTFVPTDAGIYFGIAQTGEIYQMKHEYALDGEFTSRTMDTSMTSTFGVFEYLSIKPLDTAIAIMTRTGNVQRVDETWSEFEALSTPYNGKIQSPKARFIQFKILLGTETNSVTPKVTSMYISYISENLAPDVLNVRLVTFNDQEAAANNDPIKRPPLNPNEAMIIWHGSDPNGDSLLYNLYYRLSGETVYSTFVNNLKTTYVVFDANTMPEAIYDFKVEATDKLDNSVSTALAKNFEVYNIKYDNIPPNVIDFNVVKSDASHKVTFTVVDKLSIIKSVKFATSSASSWSFLAPDDGIVDSRIETFTLDFSGEKEPVTSVSIEVSDIEGNTRYYSFFVNVPNQTIVVEDNIEPNDNIDATE